VVRISEKLEKEQKSGTLKVVRESGIVRQWENLG